MEEDEVVLVVGVEAEILEALFGEGVDADGRAEEENGRKAEGGFKHLLL